MKLASFTLEIGLHFSRKQHRAHRDPPPVQKPSLLPGSTTRAPPRQGTMPMLADEPEDDMLRCLIWRFLASHPAHHASADLLRQEVASDAQPAPPAPNPPPRPALQAPRPAPPSEVYFTRHPLFSLQGRRTAQQPPTGPRRSRRRRSSTAASTCGRWSSARKEAP